jgi:hypothetical protein
MTESVREAQLKRTEAGLIPQAEGWFVLNARDVSWIRSECVIVMTGSRAGGFKAVYPVNEVAAKHGASVLEETSKPAEAYARFGQEERSAYRDGWLP